MKTTIQLLFLLISLPLFSQSDLFYENYSWDESPNYKQTEDNALGIMALKDKYVIEFAYTDKNKGLMEFYLKHQVLWLDSDEKIEANNKIYLPYSSNSELLVSKARVITKNGKIIVLDDSKILTAQDEESGKQYKYFAFEGIDKGSFIEYYYVEKKYPRYKGIAFRLQGSFDKKNVEFDLFSPSNLVFQFKSYNDLPSIEKDTLSKDKLHWKLSLKELKGLENETQSAYQASRGSIVYKLDKNLKNNMSDISSYSKVAQNIHGFYYAEPSKEVKKSIAKFSTEAISKNDEDEESKIRSLDRFIKTNVAKSDGNSDELKDLADVLRNKVANSTGMIKLYVALLNSLNIKYEIVITCDRELLKFDKEFEADNFLTDFLFYFPKHKSYLSPEDVETRYGFPPANLTDNFGLFIKEVKVGDFKSATAKIKYIASLEANKTVDRMTIDVNFDKNDISKNVIKLDRSFTGYYGQSFHPYMHLVKGKDKDELIENLAKSMHENVVVIKKEIINEAPELFGVKPLHFIIDLETEAFTTKAGNKYLFNVGEIIGRQIQMYQEKKRALPLEDQFKRSYYRTINITLPKGYKVANLEDINIDNSYSRDNTELLSFKSFYEVKDNTITITADEHYKLNIIDTSFFEDYRKVINSAADFNKITLVLEPISED